MKLLLASIDVLKQITENASEKLSSAIQFSIFNVFFGLFLNSTYLLYQNSSNCRADLKILVLNRGLGNENLKSLDFEKP